jgi:hypothetical protein
LRWRPTYVDFGGFCFQVGSFLIPIRSQDFDTIARIGHILKGVGGNLGHAAVTDLGRAIQLAAFDRNTEQVRPVLTLSLSRVLSLTPAHRSSDW